MAACARGRAYVHVCTLCIHALTHNVVEARGCAHSPSAHARSLSCRDKSRLSWPDGRMRAGIKAKRTGRNASAHVKVHVKHACRKHMHTHTQARARLRH